MLSDIQKIYLIGFLRNLTFFGAITVPFFLEWGKLSYTQIFLLQSWFSFWVVVMEIPTGALADKISRKLSMGIGLIITSIGILIYSSIPNFIVFLLAEFLAATGSSFFSGADKAFIYDTLKEKKKTKEAKYIFSNYELYSNIGIMVALPLGSFLAGLMIWSYPRNLVFPMFLTFFPFFIGGITALTAKEPRRKTPEENYIDLAKSGIKHLFTHQSLRTLGIDMISISSLTFFIYWLYQPLLSSAGVDVKYFGFVGGFFVLLGSIFLSKIKTIENTFGTKRLIFLTALVPSIMYLILAFSTSLVISIVAIFLVASLRVARIPIFHHYMNKFVRSKNRATVFSGISMSERLLLTITYPIVGFLLDWSLKNTLIIFGIVGLILTFTSKITEDMLTD